MCELKKQSFHCYMVKTLFYRQFLLEKITETEKKILFVKSSFKNYFSFAFKSDLDVQELERKGKREKGK